MGFLQPPTRLRSRRKRDHKRDRDESAIKEHDVHAHATEGKSVKRSKSNRRLATAAASTPSCPLHVQFSVKMRLASLNSGVENDSLRGRKW